MIVVLGASGRTGRVVARLVCAAQTRVRVVTRGSALGFDAPGVEHVRARLSHPEELSRALDGARAVYALLPDDFGAEQFHAERRASVENLIGALRGQAVPHVVALSSRAAALGEHAETGFARELARLERRLFETVPAVTVLRACYFQDNVAQGLAMAARDGVYINCLPSAAPIEMVAASDVAAIAARALLQSPGAETPPCFRGEQVRGSIAHEIVDVSGPAYSPADIAAALGDCVGRRVSLVNPAPEAQKTLFRQWMSEQAAQAMLQTLSGLSAPGLTLRGSRHERGTTRLEQVLSAAREVAP